MKFRKLLAFVLVFSLATQPGGVRFGYAEDTKAAEVENKAEASDEVGIDLDEAELDEYLFDPDSREQNLEEAANVAAEETAKTSKISGALAGAIAAGAAAVIAAVGTAGLMIYNGVSNKDEIAKLWTAEGGSFFSRLGKTISILIKGIKEEGRYGQDNEEVDLPTEEDQASLFAQKQEVDLSPEEEQASLFSQKQKDNPLMRKILTDTLETHNDAVEEKNESVEPEQQETQESSTESGNLGEQEQIDLTTQEPTGIISKDKVLCDEGKLTEDYCEQLKEKLNVKQPSEEPEEPTENVENDQNIENQQEDQLTDSDEQPTGSNSSSDDVQQQESDSNQEEPAPEETPESTPELSVAKTKGQQKLNALTTEIGKAEGRGGEALENANTLKTKLTDALNGVDTEAINTAASKVDGVVEALQQAVADEKKAEEERKAQEALQAAKQNGRAKLNELNTAIDAAEGKGGNALTKAEELKTELTNALNGTNAQAIDDAANKVDGVVEVLQQAVADEKKAEEERKKEEERKAKEEAKRETRCPLSREANDLIEKKNSALNTLNKLGDTCGLDTVGLKSELNALALETLTTPEELAQAKIKLNSIINRINGLRGNCATLKFDKAYIEKNWQTVVSILDSSDASLRNDFGTLKLQRVTEGNLETLAEEYKNIAGRVKAVIDNNNAIPKLTEKISKVIEDNKNAEWFDEAYYNEKLNNLSNKVKTEEGLKEIVNELEELAKAPEVNKWRNKINNGVIMQGNCDPIMTFWDILDTISDEGCATLRGKVDEEVKRLKAKFKKDHDVDAFIKALKELHNNSQSYINDATYLEFDANAAEEIINEADKFGLIDAEYFRKELAEKKTYLLENLKNQRTDMKAFLNELKTNFGMENLNTLNSLDSEINKIISAFGEYEASYVSQYKEKYAAKREELKGMYDAGKAVAELEKYKKELQINLDKLKKSCENRPETFGKK